MMKHFSINVSTQWLATCGIVMPIVDVLITIWLASLNPGYSHSRQFISELGETGRPYAFLFSLWSFLYGGLFAAFSVALHRSFERQNGFRLGLTALLVVAASSAAGGFFPCDEGCSAGTLSGQIHIAAGSISLIGTLVAAFLTYSAMARSELWRNYSRFTLAVAILLSSLSVWLTLCYFVGLTPHLAGVVQRAFAVVLYAWIEVLSFRLWAMAGN
jgi:hypothetical membrane protein